MSTKESTTSVQFNDSDVIHNITVLDETVWEYRHNVGDIRALLQNRNYLQVDLDQLQEAERQVVCEVI